jgi:OmcA/MtrC family decaheme c-type cytochrome
VAKVPAGFSGSPSFLVAHGGSAASTKDYTNFDEIPTGGFGASFATAQPKSVTIVGLPVTATDNTNTKFRTKLTGANTFPAGAKMRAVALQGYFTQISGGVGLDNVGRHTPAVAKAVTGDTVRRVIVKSGYDNVAGVLTPVGCLECHEVFEGHGGNRVNNVQVCVMCHNPNMTTSARTIPDNVTKNAAVVAKYPGSSLTYPEVAQNMAEMIHGIHATDMRVNSFDIIRNRAEVPGVFGVEIFGAELTPYPGDLSRCQKCHLAGTYGVNLPAGVQFTTEKVTTGNASETLDNIIAARKSFPNATDLVDSPVVGKCGYCHDAPAAVGHFISNGGDVKQPRSTAELAPPLLAPEYLAAP